MTPERWKRLEELFHAALERGSGQREAFLASACGRMMPTRPSTRSTMLVGSMLTSMRLASIFAMSSSSLIISCNERPDERMFCR